MAKPGMPYAAAREAISGFMVTAESGVAVAYRLFSQTNTTGARITAAKFSASWKPPWLVAPSPKNGTAMPWVPRWRAELAAPTPSLMPRAPIP